MASAAAEADDSVTANAAGEGGGIVWYAWGSGGTGVLMHGNCDDVHVPTQVKDTVGLTMVATGGCHVIGMSKKDGTLWACGRNLHGQLGSCEAAQEDAVATLYQVTALAKQRVALVACGWQHSAAVTADGALYTWGDGTHGQLGHGPAGGGVKPVSVAEPALVTRLPWTASESGPVVAVACGFKHTVLATGAGMVAAAGSGAHGQLGIGLQAATTVQKSAKAGSKPKKPKAALVPWFTAVAGFGDCFGNAQAVCCGWQHSVAVTTSGKVYAWGNNKFGQLGNGTNSSVQDACAECGGGGGGGGGKPTTSGGAGGGAGAGAGLSDARSSCVWSPVAVKHMEGCVAKQATCGWYHNCVVARCGKVWAWGRGTHGQLGDGGWTTTVHVPQRVPLASRAVLVACGSESSHAIDAEGRLWSWGWCEHGNLGTGDTKNQASPVHIELPHPHSTLVALAAAGAAVFVGARAAVT